MTIDRTNRQIKLRDGRSLGYAEYGNPDGKAVVYIHGFPGSRLDWPIFDSGETAAELKARVISIDRPGMGLSDPKPGREILDWPDDVIELADALHVDRFAVLGISGGGPFTAACAFKIAKRLSVVAIVCGMGPSEAPRAKEGMSMFLPGQPSEVRRQILMGIASDPDQIALQMKGIAPEPDRVLLDQPALSKALVDAAREAVRSGIDGADQDALLYTRPWGFQLQDITAEVHLWHGEQDANVPVAVGRYVANAIPNCHATFFEGEGHFSLPHNHIREILNVLVSQ